jgi:hypothetical protein
MDSEAIVNKQVEELSFIHDYLGNYASSIPVDWECSGCCDECSDSSGMAMKKLKVIVTMFQNCLPSCAHNDTRWNVQRYKCFKKELDVFLKYNKGPMLALDISMSLGLVLQDIEKVKKMSEIPPPYVADNVVETNENFSVM